VNAGLIRVFVMRVRLAVVGEVKISGPAIVMGGERKARTTSPQRGNTSQKHEQTADDGNQTFHCEL